MGYVRVVIEIVGRNHPPEFPNCTFYSSWAKAPENMQNAFVIQVSLPFYSTEQHMGIWVM